MSFWANLFSKLPVVVLLRERISICEDNNRRIESENTNLKSEAFALNAKLEIEGDNHKQTKKQLDDLKEFHKDDARSWRTIEFRKGHRTFGKWQAFCPSCHMQIELNDSVDGLHCPTVC